MSRSPTASRFSPTTPTRTAIACYVEAIKDGERFAAAVTRARENGKPVIVMKVGGSTIGAAAAASHTASLAGTDAVYDAALRQLGVERAKTPGGPGRDRLCLHPRPAAALAPPRGGDDVGRRRRADGRRLRGAGARPRPARRGFAESRCSSWVPFAAPRNPVDVTAQALNDPSILDKGFDLLLGKEKFPAMVGFFTTWASSPQMAEPLFKSLSGAAERYPDAYLALSAIAAPEMQRRYEAAGIGFYEDPWRAVESIAAAMRCAERIATPPHAGPAGAGRCRAAARRARLASTRPSASSPRPASRSCSEMLATSAAEAAAASKLGDRSSSRSSRPRSPIRPRSAASCSTSPAAEAGAAYDRADRPGSRPARPRPSSTASSSRRW